MSRDEFPGWHGTTIIGVKKDGKVVIAGDGQVSLGQTVIKGTARKVRKLSPGGFDVIAGFAGRPPMPLPCLNVWKPSLRPLLASLPVRLWSWPKDWRTDKYLQKLEAMLIVTDGKDSVVITGRRRCLEPEHDVAAIGSGGNFALAARAA